MASVPAAGPGSFPGAMHTALQGNGKVRSGSWRSCFHSRWVIIDALDGFVSIGADTTINPYCVLYGTGGLTIGALCGIAAHCVMIPANHGIADPVMPMMRQPVSAKGDQHRRRCLGGCWLPHPGRGLPRSGQRGGCRRSDYQKLSGRQRGGRGSSAVAEISRWFCSMKKNCRMVAKSTDVALPSLSMGIDNIPIQFVLPCGRS